MRVIIQDLPSSSHSEYSAAGEEQALQYQRNPPIAPFDTDWQNFLYIKYIFPTYWVGGSFYYVKRGVAVVAVKYVLLVSALEIV